MLFVLCVVIGALLGRGMADVEESDKKAYATCRLLTDRQDTIDIDFKLVVGTDYDRRLIALDQAQYDIGVYTTPSGAGQGCIMEYEPTDKIYHAQIRIDTDGTDGINNDNNHCGMQTLYTPTQRMYFRVMFLHQTTDDNINMLETKDRVYIVDCYEDEAIPNSITAHMTVNRPNIRTVVPQTVAPTLIVMRRDSTGSFQPISSGDQVTVGSQLKLMLHYNYGTYSEGVFICAGGKETTVSQFPQFNTYRNLLNVNGCPAQSSPNFPVIAPDEGFVVTDDGRGQQPGAQICKSETGAFTLWSWDAPPYALYIRVYYILCHENDHPLLCSDPCLYYLTYGQRRRRDIEEKEYAEIMINVYDPAALDGNNEEVESAANVSGMMIGVIVGCVVVCAIACILLVAIVCFMKRRSSSEKDKFPPGGFENHGYVKY